MITETAPSLNALTTVGKTGSMQWSKEEFETAFLEHYPRVLGVLLRLLGDRTCAEELANDVFLKLYRNATRGEVDGRVGGWLYRAATNVGIDALRSAARRRKYETAAARSQEGAAASPFDDMVREEQRRRVRAVLAAIRPAQAQILILRASGFSYKELAEVLQGKPAGIGTMLSRAQNEFRKVYLQMHGSEEKL